MRSSNKELPEVRRKWKKRKGVLPPMRRPRNNHHKDVYLWLRKQLNQEIVVKYERGCERKYVSMK